MIDSNNREIKYLRLSITDMCNFRCAYCMPEDSKFEAHNLSLDNIELIASNLNTLGIKKVKLTGGEPLVRNDISQIVSLLKTKCNIDEVTLTTNGALLAKHLPSLEQAKLDAITISIDTIDPTKFNNIVRRDQFEQVLSNIKLAKRSSISNIKLNCVPLKQFGDDNIIEMCKFASEQKIPLRFIEMMPIGLGRNFPGYDYQTLLKLIEANFGAAVKSSINHGNGPAQYFKFEQLEIEIGFIQALSNKFCDSCNRVRVTSQGHLKQCLHYNYNIDLIELLKTKEGLEQVKDFILAKPQEHAFTKTNINKKDLETLHMSEIGG